MTEKHDNGNPNDKAFNIDAESFDPGEVFSGTIHFDPYPQFEDVTLEFEATGEVFPMHVTDVEYRRAPWWRRLWHWVTRQPPPDDECTVTIRPVIDEGTDDD